MACLFAAGVTTHILLAAGLRSPTIRGRYAAARELLADYRRIEFHEALLGLLGSAGISRRRASEHLATLAEIFDAAKERIRTPFPFACDISEAARPMAIEGSLELIRRGQHREAMFWIGVTQSRCQKVLSCDATENLTQHSYRELIGDLGLLTGAEIRGRYEAIKRMLPQVCEVAEEVIAANREIEAD